MQMQTPPPLMCQLRYPISKQIWRVKRSRLKCAQHSSRKHPRQQLTQLPLLRGESC